MQEELLIDAREKLELHKGNENKTRYEVIDLKQKIEMCNKTIINLEEEIKANNILIPKLQSTIDVSRHNFFIIISCKFPIIFVVIFDYNYSCRI